MAVLNLGGEMLSDKANDDANENSQANIEEEINRFEIRTISKAALFPEEEREPGAADVVGAVREAQHGGQATIGLEVGSEEIDCNKQVEGDEGGKGEDKAGFSSHWVVAEVLFQKSFAERCGLGETDGLQIRLRAAVLLIEVIQHPFHIVLNHRIG